QLEVEFINVKLALSTRATMVLDDSSRQSLSDIVNELVNSVIDHLRDDLVTPGSSNAASVKVLGELNRVDLPEDWCISLFMAGLQSDTEFTIRMFRPRTLADYIENTSDLLETNSGGYVYGEETEETWEIIDYLS
ncbi:hypothetical protein Tco_1224166, partial [Tanacetum coccineum]